MDANVKETLEARLVSLKAKQDRLSKQSPKPAKALLRTANFIKEIQGVLGSAKPQPAKK